MKNAPAPLWPEDETLDPERTLDAIGRVDSLLSEWEELGLSSVASEESPTPGTAQSLVPDSPFSPPASPKGNAAIWSNLQDDKIVRVWLGGLTGNQIGLPSKLDDAVRAGDEDRIPVGDILLRVRYGSKSESLESSGSISQERFGDPRVRAMVSKFGLRFGGLYRIGETIGRGGFASVRQATHKRSEKNICVKIILKEFVSQVYEEYTVKSGMFEMLMKTSMETPHANIVQYLDILESPTRYYVTMERLQGPTLADMLEAEGSNWNEQKSAAVMHDLLSALDHIHRVIGVYHCDVKLENLGFRSQTSGLLTDGRLESALVLFDFGLSRFIGQKWDGKFAGTAIYTAPEILQEMRVVEECRSSASPTGCYSLAVDLWAAGMILFVLLTGDFLFDDSGEFNPASLERFVELQNENAPSLRILEGLMQIDPMARMRASTALQDKWLRAASPQPAKYLRAASPQPYKFAVRKSGASKTLHTRHLAEE